MLTAIFLSTLIIQTLTLNVESAEFLLGGDVKISMG